MFEEIGFHLECKSLYPRSHRYSKRGNHGVEVLREKGNPNPEGERQSKSRGSKLLMGCVQVGT